MTFWGEVMARTTGDRIAEIYLDAHWQAPRDAIRLTSQTARALRDEGVTMVRVAPSFWGRVSGRARGVAGRDISLARYLNSAERGSRSS